MLVGSIIGIGVLGLGLIFGFVLLGPCGGNGCVFITGGVVDWTDSGLLSWGLIILGIGILAASLLIGRMAVTSKNNPAA
jgi:1,4-dihydroxy-2-naphthoate octaprenyltransferase